MKASERVQAALDRALSDYPRAGPGAGPAAGRIYVGYSGGVDSSVLLHAANVVRAGAITALHVNHGLHRDAEQWVAHCERVCERLGVPLRCHSAEVTPHGNTEAAARAARYAYFAHQVAVNDVLLLAHQRDDQLETLLLRLFQGRGLYGIPARRVLGGGVLMRPLLDLPRALLVRYAQAEGLTWIEDPANAELERDRNLLRHRVLPMLRERWPNLDRAVLDAGTERAAADAAWSKLLTVQPDRVPLSRLPPDPAVAAHALRVWLTSLGVRLPTKAALTNFVGQLSAPADRQPTLSLDQGSLRRYRDHVHFVNDPPRLASHYPLAVPGTLTLPHGALQVRVAAGGFVPAGEVRVEFARGRSGTQMHLPGHRRGVRALLGNAGIPPWLRDSYPLLVDDLGIVAVPGIIAREASSAPEGAPGYVCDWRPIEGAR